MRIEELMTRAPVSCDPDDSLNTAAHLMWVHDIGSVLVVDKTGVLVGMITDRDACMGAYTQGKLLEEIRVSSAMAAEVISCVASDSIEAAERKMASARLHRLPIVDGNGKPVGVVSINDIVRRVAKLPKADRDMRDLALTLSHICSPRPKSASAIDADNGRSANREIAAQA